MHVEFLLIDNGKMSKSLHNVYTLDDLEKRGIEPLAYRYFTYTSHYRNKLNFTWDGIKSCQVSLDRLRELVNSHKDLNNNVDDKVLKDFENRFIEAINDDLNMPVAISIVWELAKYSVKSNKIYELIMKFDSILSLDLNKVKKDNKNVEVPNEILELLEQRKKARESKDYALSDTLRDKIKEKGYIVKDTKEGQEIEKV